jgi:hypothetical protein
MTAHLNSKKYCTKNNSVCSFQIYNATSFFTFKTRYSRTLIRYKVAACVSAFDIFITKDKLQELSEASQTTLYLQDVLQAQSRGLSLHNAGQGGNKREKVNVEKEQSDRQSPAVPVHQIFQAAEQIWHD